MVRRCCSLFWVTRSGPSSSKANVEYLLRHGGAGATISPEDVRAACNESNTAILTLLLDHGGTLPPDNEVVTMISFSDDKRALAVLELLHSRGTDLAAAYRTTRDGVTYNFFALHDATMHAATSCIQFLLSIGADPVWDAAPITKSLEPRTTLPSRS